MAKRSPDPPAAAVKVAGVLYREATLAGQDHGLLTEWLRLTADALIERPDAPGATVLALVVERMHTLTACEGCDRCSPNGLGAIWGRNVDPVP